MLALATGECKLPVVARRSANMRPDETPGRSRHADPPAPPAPLRDPLPRPGRGDLPGDGTRRAPRGDGQDRAPRAPRPPGPGRAAPLGPRLPPRPDPRAR